MAAKGSMASRAAARGAARTAVGAGGARTSGGTAAASPSRISMSSSVASRAANNASRLQQGGYALNDKGNAALSQLNQAMSSTAESNPAFNSYVDYYQQLQNMDPTARENYLSQIREQAKTYVDPDIDKQEAFARQSLQTSLSYWQSRQGTLTQQEKDNLTNAIQGLDRDSALAMNSNLTNAIKSGTLNSGVMADLAQRVMSAYDLQSQSLSKNAQANIDQINNQANYGIANAQEAYDTGNYSLENQRKADTENQISTLLSQNAASNFNLQSGSAANLTPGATNTAATRAAGIPTAVSYGAPTRTDILGSNNQGIGVNSVGGSRGRTSFGGASSRMSTPRSPAASAYIPGASRTSIR